MSSVARHVLPVHLLPVEVQARVTHRLAVRKLANALLEEEMVPHLAGPGWALEAVFAGCDQQAVAPLLDRLRKVTIYGLDFAEPDGTFPLATAEDAVAEQTRVLNQLMKEYDEAMTRIYGGAQ